MFSYILIATLVVAASANSVSIEDNEITRAGRIIGGEPTTIRKYPYQVSVLKDGRHYCGGSIISPHYVLTASQCLYPGSHYAIRTASTYYNQGGKVYNVESIQKHPNYTINQYGIPINDIALIRVSVPFEFNCKTQPIEAFQAGEPSLAGANAVITGWGRTNTGTPSILQTVTVPIIDRKVCDEAYQNVVGGIPEGQICAGLYKIGGKGACHGDSGSPLTIQGRQAGVVSWGFGCAKAEYPDVYTEVAYYRDWINENAKE